MIFLDLLPGCFMLKWEPMCLILHHTNTGSYPASRIAAILSLKHHVSYLCTKYWNNHSIYSANFSWHDGWLKAIPNAWDQKAYAHLSHGETTDVSMRRAHENKIQINEAPLAGRGWAQYRILSNPRRREGVRGKKNQKERRQWKLGRILYLQDTDLVLEQPATTKNIFGSQPSQFIVHVLKNVRLVHRQGHFLPCRPSPVM